MADQPMNSGPIPTQLASKFGAAFTYGEILLSVGETKVTMKMSAEGGVPAPAIDWIVTLALSPQTASQLSAILDTILSTYVNQFGAIPADPTFKVNVDTQAGKLD